MTNSYSLRAMKNSYAWLVLGVIPLLAIYVIPNTDIVFSSIGLIAFLFVVLLYTITHPVILVDWVYAPFFLYIILQSILTSIVNPSINIKSLAFSVGRYAAFLFLLCFYNKAFFDKAIFTKLFKLLGDITTGYILLQQALSSLFSINLGAGIPFLPIINEDLRLYGETRVKLYGQLYRPRSLFSEPATYATFTVLVLIIELYSHNHKGWKSFIRPFCLSLGIMVSKSSLGVVVMLFVWGLYVFNQLKSSKKSFWKVVSVFLIISPIIFVVMMRNSSVQYQLERFFTIDFLQKEPRLSIFYNLDVLDLTSMFKALFGHDFNLSVYKADVFLPSFFRQLYCFGVVGFLILIVLLFKLYKRGDTMQKVILLAFIVQMLGSECLHGGYMFVYFVWLVKMPKTKELKIISNSYTEKI